MSKQGMSVLNGDDLLVVSSVLENNNLVGFLVASSSGAIKIVDIETIQKFGNKVSYINARYSDVGKTLDGTMGASLSSYGAISKDYVLLRPMAIVVMANLYDTVSKRNVGVLAYNSIGTRYMISYQRLEELARRFKCCNFDIINDGKGVKVLAKDGSEFKTVGVALSNKPKAKAAQHLGIKVQGKDKLPVLDNIPALDLNTSEVGLTAQEKLTKAILNMQILTPYYYTMLMAIRRIPAGIGTMGVTEDTMYYDPVFLVSQSIPQLTFVLIHEMLHIAMQHSIRFGNRTNHDLWNIATDLYINQVICNDFNIKFRGSAFEYKTDGGRTEAAIKTPDEGVFIETIHKQIDLAVDTPETIYRDLLKENGGQGSSSSQQSNGSSSQSSGSGTQSGDSNGKGDNSDGQGDDSANDDSSGSGSKKNNQNRGSKSKSSKNGNSDMMQDASKSDSVNDMDNQEFEGTKEVSVIYKGERLTGKINIDVLTNKDGEQSDDAHKQNVESSRDVLQRIKTGMKLAEEKGIDLQKNVGVGAGLCTRYIEVGLSANLDWRVLLRNVCKDKPKKVFTLGNPNVDYMSLGMTVAGRRRIGKPERLAHVKFAVDVSGSVSERELKYMLSEIANIFNIYKLDGELIYWSDTVQSVGMFSSLRDMLKIPPVSSGGTDVRGVFEYLSRKVDCNGVYEDDSMRDIKAIFIITDGCFSSNYEDYIRGFGRKVVWLITGVNGNPITFNPPFGRVLALNLPR